MTVESLAKPHHVYPTVLSGALPKLVAIRASDTGALWNVWEFERLVTAADFTRYRCCARQRLGGEFPAKRATWVADRDYLIARTPRVCRLFATISGTGRET